jgi:hypothetical protein
LAIQLEQAPAASFIRAGRGAQRSRLEHAQDLANVPELGSVQGTDPKTAPQAGVEHTLTYQAEQSLPNRRPAHPQLLGQRDVPNSAPGREIAAQHLGENTVVDLVTKRDA